MTHGNYFLNSGRRYREPEKITAGEVNWKIGLTNASITRLEELNHKAHECECSIKKMAKSFVKDRN